MAALSLAGTAQAAVEFENLGYRAPPASVGGIAVTPFDLAPQAAIADLDWVGTIPGSPLLGDLTVAPDVQKHTMPSVSWYSVWSDGYTGPVFFSGSSQQSLTLTLPPQTTAFYFHVQPSHIGPTFEFTATTDSGATSGPVQITTPGVAPAVSDIPGLAFYATDPAEYISTIQISADTSIGFGMAQFGISSDAPPAAPVAVPTLGQWSLMLLGLLAAGLGARRLRRQG